ALSLFDRQMTVYVPDMDGTAQIAKKVCLLIHMDIPVEGITIPPDVVIIPESLIGEAILK
ncbi:hypothetical protein, partial [Bifidobacterium pullorum]